jgi:hypothetical protein
VGSFWIRGWSDLPSACRRGFTLIAVFAVLPAVLHRTVIAAVIAAAAIWGSAVGTAPVGAADPSDINCTQATNDARCVYTNCTDAKADGRCNIRVGDPAYCPSQDFDHDGIACKCGTVNPGD